MAFVAFNKICPSIAIKDISGITLLTNDNEFGLPKGNYSIVELFCDECDCNRAFLQFFLDENLVATISYGWEKLSFYSKMFKGFELSEYRQLKGPALDMYQPQSHYADKILKLFENTLYKDKIYMANIEKHYAEFKKAIKESRK